MTSKLHKIYVDKLVSVPVDLGKLNDLVKNNVIEKDVYNTKIKDIEYKISEVTNLATNTTLNAKVNKVKSKISNITNLATTTSVTAVENKVPDRSKYIISPEFYKLTAEKL